VKYATIPDRDQPILKVARDLPRFCPMMTYANQLTILRMVFIPFFVLLLAYGHLKAGLLVFALAGITDLFDGFLARKLQQKTALGSYLDPMADKLLITSAFVTLTIPSVPVAVHIPLWLTITAFSRDLLIALAVLIIHLHTGHGRFPPSMIGKLTTTFQLLAVALALATNLVEFILPLFMPVAVAALLLTIASGMHYFYSAVKLMESYQRMDPAHERKRSPNS
jgi:cardiolipin synthase